MTDGTLCKGVSCNSVLTDERSVVHFYATKNTRPDKHDTRVVTGKKENAMGWQNMTRRCSLSTNHDLSSTSRFPCISRGRARREYSYTYVFTAYYHEFGNTIAFEIIIIFRSLTKNACGRRLTVVTGIFQLISAEIII